MKPLESRKQLLIAESELNRAQLLQEWQVVRLEVQAMADQAKSVRSMASAVVTLVAGATACCHKKTAPGAKKPSWLESAIKGASMISNLWQSFRPPGGAPPDTNN